MQEKPSTDAAKRKAARRIEEIRRKIASMDHVCSGTVVSSMIKCGKANCRCATDRSARHGPYHQWNRMRNGKLIHSTINTEQAEQLRQAIGRYRTIQKLLRQWEQETATILEIRPRRK
jgi:hypothetical protein